MPSSPPPELHRSCDTKKHKPLYFSDDLIPFLWVHGPALSLAKHTGRRIHYASVASLQHRSPSLKDDFSYFLSATQFAISYDGARIPIWRRVASHSPRSWCLEPLQVVDSQLFPESTSSTSDWLFPFVLFRCSALFARSLSLFNCLHHVISQAPSRISSHHCTASPFAKCPL